MSVLTHRPTHLRVDPSALALAGEGRVFDLSSGWWPGMPLAPGHPPFQVLTFRTPAGERAQGPRGDLEWLGDNTSRFGFISEILSFCAHSGTHIDALAHITSGENDEWYGGYSAREHLGDHGPLTHDASTLPPLVCRAVLVDAPRALGQDTLRPHQPVDADLISLALARQDVRLREGDVVLLRTGTMKHWPDTRAMTAVEGAGLDLDGATLLARHRPAAVGSDTAAVEVAPSGVAGEPQPVHRLLIRDLGIPLMEWVYLEELAAAAVHEFLLLCLPLPITGATGSPVRPVAIA
ncbi:kynurenine formamidase [Streptomyces africanus]|uniref:Kynurenine formamidase n=1 Tax=Streptomyces africanus TaxID=231024 RepID=A0ABU0QF24_9ACTN|nr:cyclase family protein [Streptomyces africanus]MDQ0745978.1 kynurenine formamidase [Streptomyces africanus]